MNIRSSPHWPDRIFAEHSEQILRLFSHAERHTLLRDAHTVQVFDTELTDLQRQVLSLLGVPLHGYQPKKANRGNSRLIAFAMCGM